MKQKGRALRVAELIRHEIAGLLAKGLKDPRIGFVSVMSVKMSSVLHYANVYVSLYGDESERKGSLIGLRNSAGWVRREVGKHLRIRFTPEIRFFPDDTLDQVYHLEEVFNEIHKETLNTPMINMDMQAVVDEISSADSFLLTAHTNPDGDAIGSILAMYHLLRALGKKRVTCVLEDPVPKRYRSLPGANKIVSCRKKISKFDMAIIMGVSSFDRIGDVAKFIETGGSTQPIIIDHHLGDGQAGAAGFIDPSYAATGEIIFELFELAQVPISPEAAHCLYVAQATDTGGYRFSNTSPRSHRIAATLIETGLDVAAISEEVFSVISIPKFNLLRILLDRMKILADGRLAYSHLAEVDMEQTGAKKEDVDGLVNYTRNIEAVEVGILFNEIDASTTKLSIRSGPNFNAAEFLSEYGGGGHAVAAGATIEKPLIEIEPEITSRIESILQDASNGESI